MEIHRFTEQVLLKSLLHYPAIALLGPRQVGKTTLAKAMQAKLERESIYIDLESSSDVQKLENAFLIRRLEPYFLNISKRLIKAPKVYIRDSGLLHTLVGAENMEDLEAFLGKGNSWEGFVLQQIIAHLKPSVDYYFYRTQDGTKLDLVLVKGVLPVLGLEIKYSNAPKLSRGTKISQKDLGDIPILVLTPSIDEDYQLDTDITVTSLDRLFLHLERYKLLG
jgi:hypothetical protein